MLRVHIFPEKFYFFPLIITRTLARNLTLVSESQDPSIASALHLSDIVSDPPSFSPDLVMRG